MEALSQLGIVTGVGEVRDKDGNLKCRFELRGTTPLTEEELRQKLSQEVTLVTEQAKEKM